MRVRMARVCLAVAALLFCVFFANVMVGAARGGVFLSDVGELLLLLACCACFVAATLLFEAHNKSPEQPDEV